MPILHQEPELTAKRTAQLTQRLMLRQSNQTSELGWHAVFLSCLYGTGILQ